MVTPSAIGIGEVRQALLTRRMLLTEDHLPLRAMQRLPVRTRRSRVRRVAAEKSRCRRSISVTMLTGRNPGAGPNIGTISLSQIAASGSGLRRPRGVRFCEGNRGSASSRAPVVVLSPPWRRRPRVCGFDGGPCTTLTC